MVKLGRLQNLNTPLQRFVQAFSEIAARPKNKSGGVATAKCEFEKWANARLEARGHRPQAGKSNQA
jgi:hypothetical protein